MELNEIETKIQESLEHLADSASKFVFIVAMDKKKELFFGVAGKKIHRLTLRGIASEVKDLLDYLASSDEDDADKKADDDIDEKLKKWRI